MSVNGPESPMGGQRPTTNQYGATAPYGAPAQGYNDQSQYVPPLQSWPPQAPGAPVYAQPKRSLVAPWLFVGLGLIIPLSALIAGIWGASKAKDDERCKAIAIVGIAVFLVMFAVNVAALNAG
jgi:hypothetical protein